MNSLLTSAGAVYIGLMLHIIIKAGTTTAVVAQQVFTRGPKAGVAIPLGSSASQGVQAFLVLAMVASSADLGGLVTIAINLKEGLIDTRGILITLIGVVSAFVGVQIRKGRRRLKNFTPSLSNKAGFIGAFIYSLAAIDYIPYTLIHFSPLLRQEVPVAAILLVLPLAAFLGKLSGWGVKLTIIILSDRVIKKIPLSAVIGSNVSSALKAVRKTAGTAFVLLGVCLMSNGFYHLSIQTEWKIALVSVIFAVRVIKLPYEAALRLLTSPLEVLLSWRKSWRKLSLR